MPAFRHTGDDIRDWPSLGLGAVAPGDVVDLAENPDPTRFELIEDSDGEVTEVAAVEATAGVTVGACENPDPDPVRFVEATATPPDRGPAPAASAKRKAADDR